MTGARAVEGCRGRCARGGNRAPRGAADVTLVVNTFERNASRVLSGGFFREIERRNNHAFAERILLINNVGDLQGVLSKARSLIADGELTSAHVVEDHLDEVLARVEVPKAELGRVLHYSDYAFVAPFVTSTQYLLYWDGGVVPTRPEDWVAASVSLLASDHRVFCATLRPCWWDPSAELTVGGRAGFAFGYGFSDQVFLTRTDELRSPIYGERCAASARYPLSHVSAVFEERVDAYMRRHRRYRAVHLDSLYEHEGRAWYWPNNTAEAVRFLQKRLTSRAAKLNPVRSNPAWKV